jgi:hypothetical protein
LLNLLTFYKYIILSTIDKILLWYWYGYYYIYILFFTFTNTRKINRNNFFTAWTLSHLQFNSTRDSVVLVYFLQVVKNDFFFQVLNWISCFFKGLRSIFTLLCIKAWLYSL